jgi:hypothetical protein
MIAPIMADAKAVAVILDFVKPLGTGRNFGAGDRDAELKSARHAL